jgi:hypothetical protein
MPRKGSPYNRAYEKVRKVILSDRPRCYICGGPGADSIDHVPPLWQHSRPHRQGSGCCVLKPAHLRCNISHSGIGWRRSNRRKRQRRAA